MDNTDRKPRASGNRCDWSELKNDCGVFKLYIARLTFLPGFISYIMSSDLMSLGNNLQSAAKQGLPSAYYSIPTYLR